MWHVIYLDNTVEKLEVSLAFYMSTDFQRESESEGGLVPINSLRIWATLILCCFLFLGTAAHQ